MSSNDEVSIEKPLPLANLVRWMVRGEQGIAAFLLFIILSTMATQVFARYVFGAPFSWSEEVARLCLIWLTFISAAFVMVRPTSWSAISSRSGSGQACNRMFQLFAAGACLPRRRCGLFNKR